MKIILAAFALFCATPALADGERAGTFDYYVLALSWTPTWCALEGDARQSDQCDPDQGFGWTLHGLWPQYVSGWPSFCRTSERDPSRAQTAAMADIMGSGGLAWHQWKKHGRCSGLTASDYFALSRLSYDNITRPELLRRLQDTVRINPSVIEAAFLEANPALRAEGLTVTCKNGFIQEVRICLSKDLEPIPCTGSVARDCSIPSQQLDPIR